MTPRARSELPSNPGQQRASVTSCCWRRDLGRVKHRLVLADHELGSSGVETL
jgi:hypothetical protein